MLNEDIITSLRNAVERGESLQDAVNVMINSGYNPAEVQEASKYIGYGALPDVKIKTPKTQLTSNPGEELVMPEQKPFFQNPAKYSRTPAVQNNSHSLSRELEKIKPSKPSHSKEIFLIIILLILVGILIGTFLYRDAILGWFS